LGLSKNGVYACFNLRGVVLVSMVYTSYLHARFNLRGGGSCIASAMVSSITECRIYKSVSIGFDTKDIGGEVLNSLLSGSISCNLDSINLFVWIVACIL